MSKSLRDQLLAAWAAEDAEPPKPVTVKGWPTIYVRQATTAEVDAAQAINGVDWKKNAQLSVGAAVVICDEKGNRLFDPNSEEDVKRIGARNWAKLSKVLEAVRVDEGDESGK